MQLDIFQDHVKQLELELIPAWCRFWLVSDQKSDETSEKPAKTDQNPSIDNSGVNNHA